MTYIFKYLPKTAFIRQLTVFLSLFSLCCSTPKDYARIKVIEVIDGDTVRLANGRLLRYIGIDTPEIRIKKGNQFVYRPQPFAEQALALNRKLVENKFVRIEFDIDKKDKYNRLLGYCFVNGVFVNGRLVQEGYAVIYTFPPNVKYTDLLVNLQKQARSEKKGLWATYQIIDHSRAQDYINQIRVVQGRIINTYQSKKCVFLNFGRDYKKDFTIVIFNNCLDLFRKKGIDPASFYRGKTVRVTGKIAEYNGPEIIVNSPHQIEVIE